MQPIWKKLLAPEAAAGGYSCNLTIGTDSGAYGYDTGVVVGEFGSIDAQPVPGELLFAAVWLDDGSYLIVWFDGEIASLLTGLDVYINGVNYGGAGSWDDSSGTQTVYETFTGPTLTSGTYLFEVK